MELYTKSGTGPFSGRDKAIKNMGGMVWLYEKHLAKFMSAYADSPLNIRNFLIEGELQEARILAHSIKGLSATLGMDRLSKASAALELAIINRSCNIEILLLNYEVCLNEILDAHQK